MPENNVIMELEEIDIEPEIGLDKELQMQENYKRIGDFIQLVDERNRDLQDLPLTGLSITKKFIPSVANIIGTDLSNYKIIRKFQFACSLMQVSRDGKIPIAMMEDNVAIMSPAYPMFEVIDKKKLLPAYLMMWFERSEFDREAAYYAIGGIRGNLTWEDFCEMTLPVPSIEKQKEIVKEYKVIQDRIELNNQLIQKLEETAQAIYKQWFVEFEFPDENGNPYKSSGGEMVWNEELGKEIPVGWTRGKLEDVSIIIMGQSPLGESYNTEGIGTPLVNGPVEFGDYFPNKSKWTTSVTKLSEVGELIVCVRGSTTGRFVKSDGRYCLGRGVCSFRAKQSQSFVDLLFKSNINILLSYTTGSTFPNWDGQTLSKFPIVIPENNLLNVFEGLIKPITFYTSNINKQNQKLSELKDLLLSKLATIEK